MEWEILGRQEVYRGFFRLERLKLRHALFQGGSSAVLTRELIRNKDAVAVLPYDPGRRRLVLVEQFRTGAITHERSPWLLEIVAGLVDAGETPESVARRELIEETGCHPENLRRIMSFYPSAGGLSERVYLFLATVDSSQVKRYCGVSEEGEDIRTSVIPIEEAYALLESDRIVSANALLGMQWLKLHIDRME
jgi:ADP-ribose pyrophosphatase